MPRDSGGSLAGFTVVGDGFFGRCKKTRASIGETTIYCVDIVCHYDILFRHTGRWFVVELARIGRVDEGS